MTQQSEQNKQTTHADDEVVEASVGRVLRRAREAAGLSLAEVTERLKLSPRQLEAIERDDFKALPGPTFVRGFVRNYARFLEVDPLPLMAVLDRSFSPTVTDGMNVGRAAPEVTDAMPPFVFGRSKWVVIIGALIVIAVVSSWMLDLGQRIYHQVIWTGHGLTPPLVQDEGGPSAQPLSPNNVIASASTVATAVSAISAEPSNGADVAARRLPALAKSIQSGKISINTTELAWVSITDATGRKLIYSHVEPGSAREVEGMPPFKVILGNAENVTLNYNGQPVDFSDKIRNTTVSIEID